MRHLSFIPPLLAATCALAAAPDMTMLKGDGWSAVFRNGVLEGLTIVLSLMTDAPGDFSYDWAAWGEPQIGAASGEPSRQ